LFFWLKNAYLLIDFSKNCGDVSATKTQEETTLVCARSEDLERGVRMLKAILTSVLLGLAVAFLIRASSPRRAY
jgi:hypothetical protein